MTAASQPSDGIVTKPSVFSAHDTIGRLQAGVESHGLTVFARVDHQANAHSVGLEMAASYVLIFGSPTAGTPLMVAAPLAALDLPLRVLVWEDGEGGAWASYVSPAVLGERYGLTAELVENIRGIEALVDHSVSPEPQ